MEQVRTPELIMGTVQLGLDYGIVNKNGMPSAALAQELLASAVENGITTFDTARAYGVSEERLGRYLDKRSVKILTKLSPITDLADDASASAYDAAAQASIEASLAALNLSKIDTLLLHRALHLGAGDGAVWSTLRREVAQGRIAKLGLSAQNPDEVLDGLKYDEVGHIQLPFNLLDRRWHASGVVDRLRGRKGITVHVRSVLLQGLLANNDAAVWPTIDGVNVTSLLDTLRKFIAKFDRTSLADLALAYVRAQDWIDGIVLGMGCLNQLQENVELYSRPPLTHDQCRQIEKALPEIPEQLINPALWPGKV